ncbi:MAG: extensin family protein, partial [Paracoccaceae bacterium]
MKLGVVTLAIGTVFAAQMILAEPPIRSLRPVARPVADARPDFAVFITSTSGVQMSIRPVARPATLRRQNTGATLAPVSVRPAQVVTQRGSVCGVRAIRGEKLATISGKLRGCGVAEPVRVSSVNGVALSQPAIMNCTTAKALNKWVKNGVKPIVARLGGGV